MCNLMMSHLTIPIPPELLNIIADYARSFEAYGTLATLCQLDKAANDSFTPKLYHLVRLTSARSLATFFDRFDTGISWQAGWVGYDCSDAPKKENDSYGQRCCELPSHVHHLEVEMEESFEEDQSAIRHRGRVRAQ
jgi:hypothetical protein